MWKSETWIIGDIWHGSLGHQSKAKHKQNIFREKSKWFRTANMTQQSIKINDNLRQLAKFMVLKKSVWFQDKDVLKKT